ncbi:MAG: PLP-dependent cysteine synthase family protein [Candidatus Bathyarchaeia archaeon]|nr:PLP-dependent cysteine synthase family protein [Candidatus Bathyarchaeota archaeon]
MRVVNSVLELIGETPVVKLRRVTEGLDAEIYVKLEYMNPSGSLKDRIALEMIRRAEGEGRLKPGYTIVEASTGNTGIALSMVGRALGYRVAIYMPEGTTPERIKIMESFGAEVHLVKLRGGPRESLAGAEVEIPTREACLNLERSNPRVWWARQFSNPANTSAHIKTGEEILKQLGRVDAFVASVGTGGTLLGVAKALRCRIPNVRIVAVEPSSAEYPLKHGYRRVPGACEEVTGGIIEEILDGGVLDEVIQVSNEEAIAMSDRLVKEEGLFAGVSGGANVYASVELAKSLGGQKRIVTVLPDSGDRYLTEKKYIT